MPQIMIPPTWCRTLANKSGLLRVIQGEDISKSWSTNPDEQFKGDFSSKKETAMRPISVFFNHWGIRETIERLEVHKWDVGNLGRLACEELLMYTE